MLFIYYTINNNCRDRVAVCLSWTAITLDGVATELDATKKHVEALAAKAKLVDEGAC